MRAQIEETAEELDATRRIVRAEHPDLTLTGLYNAMHASEVGDPVPRDTLEGGRVAILSALHRQLDILTTRAYGLEPDLAPDERLARLLALNAERRREEMNGRVRWLRPTFQAPVRASGGEQEMLLLDAPSPPLRAPPQTLTLPLREDERPRAVEAVLRTAHGALSLPEIAAAFSRGRNMEAKVAAALRTLTRYGWVSELSDGRFLARLAA